MSRRILFATISLSVLTACSTTEKADRGLTAMHSQAAALANTKPPALPTTPSVRPPRPYLGVLQPQSDRGDPLPASCEAITLKKLDGFTLPQIGQEITRKTGVPIDFDPAFYKPDSSSGEPPAAMTAPQPAVQVMDSARTPLSAFPFNGKSPVIPSAASMSVADRQFMANYQGKCAELFDQMAAHYDAVWVYRGGRIRFDHMISRVFPIKASVLSGKVHADISAAATASGKQAGSTSTNQHSSVDSPVPEVWADIESTLAKMLPKDAYSISKSMSTVRVKTTPSRMREVSAYLDETNAILGINVYVQVTAFYVSVNASDEYGFDVNALWTSGTSGGLQLGMSSVLPNLSSAAGSGGMAVLSNPNGRSSHWAGTQVLFNALSRDNRLAEVRSGYAICKNGTPTPISTTTDQDIVRQVAFNTVSQSGTSSTTATADTINYGFSLQIVPRVVSPTEVDLFYTFNGTDLDNLTTFSLGTSGSLQLATMGKRNLWNDMTLKSGQTLITAGTEQNRVEHNKLGVGDASFWGLGGSSTGKVTRTRLILLVTPTILPGNDSGPMQNNSADLANTLAQPVE